MAKVWFRARHYGWGWTPANIEGWLVVAAYLVAVGIDVLVYVRRLRAGGDQRSAWLGFVGWLVVLVIALLAVCWSKGERPRWRWGGK